MGYSVNDQLRISTQQIAQLRVKQQKKLFFLTEKKSVRFVEQPSLEDTHRSTVTRHPSRQDVTRL